jgi:hypothetical protein
MLAPALRLLARSLLVLAALLPACRPQAAAPGSAESWPATVVSGYWRAGAGAASHAAWFNATLRLNAPYVFFFEDDAVRDAVQAAREGLPPTRFIRRPLANFSSRPRYNATAWLSPAHVPTPELGMVRQEKAACVADAAALNAFGSEWFAWVDAGVAALRNAPPPRAPWPDRALLAPLPHDKLICTTRALPAGAAGDDGDPANERATISVSGAAFLVHRDAAPRVRSALDAAVAACGAGAGDWRCGSDAHLLTWLRAAQPELFWPLGGDGGGGNASERQSLIFLLAAAEPPPPPPAPPPAPLPAGVTLTALPWNTTFARDAHTYAHVGWRRRNATEELASGHVAQRGAIASWDDRPGCAVIAEYLFGTYKADETRLSFCNGTLPPRDDPSAVTITPPQPAVEVAVCVPPLHGPLNATWMSDWLAWHAALGVSAFYVYIVDLSLVPHGVSPPAGTQLHWMNVSWLAGFDSHSLGQLWAMHDCLYRLKASGAAAWALFMDVDELLTLPPLQDGVAGLTRFLSARGLGAATFGSVPYLPAVCAPVGDGGGARVTLAQRAVFRARHAEGCAMAANGWSADAWRSCPNWHGRRKFIARMSNTTQVDVHGVWAGDFGNDAGIALDASTVWLKHVRGAPFAAGGRVCGGEPRCVPIPGGVNCSGFEGAPGDGFYDDAPFIAQAALAVLGAPAPPLMSSSPPPPPLPLPPPPSPSPPPPLPPV